MAVSLWRFTEEFMLELPWLIGQWGANSMSCEQTALLNLQTSNGNVVHFISFNFKMEH